jgi:hypothetical protein
VSELAKKCVENPKCRKAFIELVKEDVEDALQKVFVEAVKTAYEKPPIWWQWLLLMGIGVLGGIGLGIALSPHVLPSFPEIPPPPPG